MRVLFIVQGEGRGHLTQALTTEALLRSAGHEVAEVLVGKSNARELPEFFTRAIKAPVRLFDSPNFLPAPANKRFSLPRSVAYNVLRVPSFARSVWMLHKRISAGDIDLVVNFYELLTGITYFFFRPPVPQASIGHQYLFLHRDFKLPRAGRASLALLRLFTRLTSLGATSRLALSFRPMPADEARRITVVPPLLRREVFALKPGRGDYLHGYMLNPGFARTIEEWHRANKDVPLRFFWDKRGAARVTRVDSTLEFHRLDDISFLRSLASCRAYATTAGFESVCEAMYFGKPILMVPAHIEQDCNAYDACRCGAGITARDFDLGRLVSFAATYSPSAEFRPWAESCARRMVPCLEKTAETVPVYPLSIAALRSMIQ